MQPELGHPYSTPSNDLYILSKEKFVANRKKCSFALNFMEYLGHIISKDCVAIDLAKITNVLNWSRP